MYLKKLIINLIFIIRNLIPLIFLIKEKQIAQILIKNSLKLSTAESCTGGLISSRVTDISGSSAYTYQNFVTYANSAKTELLGVNKETIENYGVVSEQVAQEMTDGLLKKYNCTIALSTTGIAGPLGATEDKPVGLVCICAADNKNKKVISYKENPNLIRPVMKYAFCIKALNLLLEFLKENYNS